MLNKNLSLFILLIMSLLLGSCSSKFKIEGVIPDAGTQSIRIVYVAPEGVKAVWVPVMKGKFKFEGSSEDLTVANIFNQQQMLIAHVAVENGDRLKLEGSIMKPYEIKITGNDVNEEWGDFVNKNSKLYSTGNHGMLDVEIEKYIRDNKGNVVSTLLLLNDYSTLSDAKNVNRLLDMIDKDARPESLLRAYKVMAAEQAGKGAAQKVSPMFLYTPKDSLEAFTTDKGKINLIYFWSIDDNSRSMDMTAMSEFASRYGSNKRLQIADIALDSDTMLWRSTLQKEAAKWHQHYWAVGGIMNGSLKDLWIRETPLVIVADSAGRQLYRGNSVRAAEAVAQSRIK